MWLLLILCFVRFGSRRWCVLNRYLLLVRGGRFTLKGPSLMGPFGATWLCIYGPLGMQMLRFVLWFTLVDDGVRIQYERNDLTSYEIHATSVEVSLDLILRSFLGPLGLALIVSGRAKVSSSATGAAVSACTGAYTSC